METVLYFYYPFEFIDKAEKLSQVLLNNGIEFIFRESKGYYPHTFIVRKSKRKWNDIYAIVNSVCPTKYRFKKSHVELVDGKLQEIVYV